MTPKKCPCCGEVHEPPRTVIQEFPGGHVEASVRSDGGFDIVRMVEGKQMDGIHVLQKNLPKLRRILALRRARLKGRKAR